MNGKPKSARPRASTRLFRARLAPSSRVARIDTAGISPQADLAHELTVLAAQLAPDIANLPPDTPRDNLILASAYEAGTGIVVDFGTVNGPERPVDFLAGDTVELRVGTTTLPTITLENQDPDDPFSPLAPDPVVFVVPNAALGGSADYRQLPMQYRLIYFGGVDTGPEQRLSVDNVPPAPFQSFPGQLQFSADIIVEGITPDAFLTDENGNQYVEARVPGYVGKKAGDVIHGYINGNVDPNEGDIGRVEFGDPDGAVLVRFPREFVEGDEDGIKYFEYDILGREGLRSQRSAQATIFVLIKSFIGDLEEPEVPAYDEDDAGEELVNEQDARDNLRVVIPSNSSIRAGDEIQIYWGTIPAPRVRVENVSDIEIILSYAIVQADWLASNPGGNDVEVATAVWFQVYRSGQKLGTSPVHSVGVNLYTAGGAVDPDPGTEPNENLLAPVLRPASGAANDDRIPIGDSTQPATVRIDKLGDNGEAIFQADDRIVVHYAGQTLAAYVVEASDLDDPDAPLEITLPADIIELVGAGTQELSYWIERDLAKGGFNTAKSPVKDVRVETAGALPGEGNLVAVQMPEVIGSSIGRDALLDGTPIAVPEYANFSPNDDIVLYVPIYPGNHQLDEMVLPGYGAADGDPDQANRFVLPKPHVMLPAEKGDIAEPGGGGAKPTRGPITVPHVFFRLPVDRIPGISGTRTFHTHVTYRVSNTIGNVTSSVKGVIIDPRGSMDNAPSASSQDKKGMSTV